MAYDITPKTQPRNTAYEDSKYFEKMADHAHEQKMQQDRMKAAQPSKYMQTLQAINSTLQTVNNGLQVAENVSTMYDQITEKSFKQEQIEKQNRLKEQIQGAINANDWNTVATIAMSDMQTASQMPEYMDMLGRMAKIEGNEGSAALLRSINTQQQGKLELEELKNLGKLQVAQENSRGKIAVANISGGWDYRTEQLKQSNLNARFNANQDFKAANAAMREEGRNIRQQNKIDANAGKSGQPTRSNFGEAPVNTPPSDNTATAPISDTSTDVSNTTITAPTESNSYINNFKSKTFRVPLTNSSQNEKISNLEQRDIDARNAPTKQEQAKAQENNKLNLENQQRTSEFVGTFQNRELGAALNDLDVDGVSAGEQITNVLKNPDKYDVQVETEPYKINNMINGGDGLKNPLNMNLSEKFNNVVAIATITDKTTGKSKPLYLNTQQANLFDDMRNYNKQYAKEVKKAMGNDDNNSTTDSLTTTAKEVANLTPNQKFSNIKNLLNDPNEGIRFANNYGIDPTNVNIKRAAEYKSFINPQASVKEVQDYVYSDKSLEDIIYDKFGGYRDAGEKFDQYIYETGESTSKYTDDYLKTQGSYDYIDSSVNVPLDVRKAQYNARSTLAPYTEAGKSRRELAKQLSIPYTSGVEIGNNSPGKNINYLTKKVVDNYVPANYKEAVMGNESLSRNIVLLSATASELGYTNNEIKDIIKLGLSSEKPLTIPQVLKKYDPKKYKALEKIGISDIPTLVGSALFGTPARVYDKLTGQKNDY